MWSWFQRARGQRHQLELPLYRALAEMPTRQLPADLQATEASDQHAQACRALEQNFLSQLRPQDDAPLLVTLAGQHPGEFITLDLPSQAKCLPVFTSGIRAGDYVRTVMESRPRVQYLLSSPVQFVDMLRDIEHVGVTQVAIDRCPRCAEFTGFGTHSIDSSDRVLSAWAISRGIEHARAELYLSYATRAARSGNHEMALNVALETVGHVTIDDPRSHFLLGRLGIATRDRALTAEAVAFLQYLKFGTWATDLGHVSRVAAFDELPWEVRRQDAT